MEKGTELVIEDRCKEELVNHYENSHGMSGVSEEDINKTFVYIDMDGSNIRARFKDSDCVKSLNYAKFRVLV